MALRRVSAFAFSILAVVPLLAYGCGGSEDRQYSGGGATGGDASAGTGGSGATGGASTGGSAGSGAVAGSGGMGSDCTSNADCLDEDACNGEETCENGYCVAGTNLSDGTSCEPVVEVGDAGVPDAAVSDAAADAGQADAAVAEFVCFSGACRSKCASDAECNDGNVCNGTESCNPSASVCQNGTPLSCDDGDDCTDNACDPESGCFYPLIDADGDGHADEALGACGDDCDDSDPDIYTGAAELCDQKDNDCNGVEDDGAPVWYPDCDGDGFAAQSAVASAPQCDPPTAASGNCLDANTATWTKKAPGPGTADCWDEDARAHPMTASENNTAWQSTAISQAPPSVDFDFNCDGNEDPRWTTTDADKAGICYCFGVRGTCSSCLGSQGWTGSTAPSCGVSREFTECRLYQNRLTREYYCGRYVDSSKPQECR